MKEGWLEPVPAGKRMPSDALDASPGAAMWHVLGTAEAVFAELWRFVAAQFHASGSLGLLPASKLSSPHLS